MILNLALMLALNAAAAPAADKPLVLKTLHSFPEGVTDPGFTVIATPTESSVNLWSLETGRQISHFELPTVEKKHEKDRADVIIHSVRPDLKLLLISARHLYFNPLFPESKLNDDTRAYTGATQGLYLVSMEDEKNIKKLRSFDGPCAYKILRTRCTGILDRRWATIAFGRYISVASEVFYDGRLKDTSYRGIINLAYDLKGKKLFENEHIEENGKVVKGSDKNYTPSGMPPSYHVSGDEQSCSIMRDGKRISFLEDWVFVNSLDFSDDNKTVSTQGTTLFKAWDTASGALKAKLDPQNPKGWLEYITWSQSADGHIVSGLLTNLNEHQVQIWNAVSGKRLAVGSGPDFADIDSFTLLPDGHRAIYVKNKRSVLVDLGLEDGPATPMAAPAIAKVDVDELPSGSSAPNADAFAVVIGVEKYRQAGVPAVDYASRDAKTMAAYLGTMGFDAKNISVLTDAQAGKVDFDKHFGKWLKNRVGPKSRVFVYYAGHGAPNPTTGAGYLMPYEADPAYLEETAYPVTQLYAELAKLPTKDVTVVLDACFSGQGERSLIAKGTRPLVPVQAARGPENAAVIAAASGSQISASDHEARHGLLTYHLLAGLHGEADANKDGMITTSELFAYARPAVERAAKLQNVEQTPTVSGDTGAAGARVWTTLKKP